VDWIFAPLRGLWRAFVRIFQSPTEVEPA
jgi:hypothetical protein